ncbi:hypothetical protein LV457_05295 [Mycobacterium sp. MYCO198283]|uniref:hypothetical protein n=1 Tax=Mycobacterium sp. MYCO198283 TaxID=2883505 RepID=UPI001E2A0C56|nr:hypothetical protein [Mycobacterium sp. MYCO198283]MCG5431707.1 hypothetical protein [Mycobacterium sp. MYCO198283]
MSLMLGFGFLWPLAPALPLALAAVTLPWERTKSFGVGALAAAFGAGVAVLTEYVLLG